MDNKSTTKRMIGAVVLVLIAALLLAWLLKGKNKSVQEQQELIADQTQEASPILGFPGVNDEDKATGDQDQVASQDGDGAAQTDGSYVIGSAEQATDSAQQQAQNALAAGGDAASATGQAITDGAKQVAGAATGAAAGAANQVGQAGQQVANATGFQVRDPQSQDGGTEQRPIVEDGQVQAGTGSMGGNEVATGTQSQQADGGATDNTQSASAAGGAATQSSGSGSAAQQTQAVAADNGSSGGSSNAAKPATKAANPRLVNEKPVPSPRTQSASAGSRSSDRSGSTSASSRSRSSASSASARSGSAGGNAVAGGSGYAIQVLAASSRSKADAVKQDIARDGYPAFVVRARVNGKTVYRVRIGTYPAKGAARAVQTRMKARYTKNQYVQNSFVTRN